MSQIPPDIPDDAVVLQSIECRQCGYDLRALPLEGDCPECGRPVLRAVLDIVDPAATSLPRISNPGRVGNGLIVLMAAIGVTSLIVFTQPILLWLEGRLQRPLPPNLLLVAAAIPLLGLAGVFLVAPARSAPHDPVVRRTISFLTLGLIIWSVSIATAWTADGMGVDLPAPAPMLMMVAGAIVTLLPFRALIRLVGERSRLFRQARGGRQRVYDLVAALGAIALGETAVAIGQAFDWEWLALGGTFAQWAASFLVVIGMVYLFVNVTWIRSAVLRPPPLLRNLVG